MNENTPSEKKKDKGVYKKLISPILSLISTILLLTLIGADIQRLTDGTGTSFTPTAIIIEAVALFILPFLFNPGALSRRFNKLGRGRAKKKKADLDLKIEKQIRFNAEYKPALVVRCPRCGFESPSYAKTCFNCGSKLNF
jgi:lipopolysaccharide biosynthesis regulator YciM